MKMEAKMYNCVHSVLQAIKFCKEQEGRLYDIKKTIEFWELDEEETNYLKEIIYKETGILYGQKN